MKITKVVITASGRVLIYRNGTLVYSGIKTDKLTYSSADSMFSINGDFNFSYDKTPVVYDFDPNPPVTLDLTPTEFLDKMTAEVFNGTDAGSGGAGGGAATADKQDDQLAYLEQIDDTIGSNADTPITDPNLLGTHTSLLKGLLVGINSIDSEQKAANGVTAIPKHIVAAASNNAQILRLGPGRTVGTGYFNVVAAGTKQIRVYDTNVSPTNPALYLNRLIYSGVATTIGQVLEIPPLNFTLGLAITMTAGTTPTDNTAVAVNSCRLTLSHT